MTEIIPKCECGCGKPLKPNRDRLYKDRGGYPHFINGHSSQVRAYKKRLKCWWCYFEKSNAGDCPACGRSSGNYSYKRFEALGWTCRQCGTRLPNALEGILVCEECRILLEKEFEERKEESRFRTKFREFRKQMNEVVQLVKEGRKLLHEINE